MLIHSGEKPYKCTVSSCKQNFRTYGHLKDHMSTHFNLRFFYCEKCGASFSRKWTLKKHYYTHTGEKPFNCQHCTKKFADKSNLTTHMKKHLSNNMSPNSNHSKKLDLNSQVVCKDRAFNFSVISKTELNNKTEEEESLNLEFYKHQSNVDHKASNGIVVSSSSFQLNGRTTCITKTSSGDLLTGIKKTDSKNNINLSTHHLESHHNEVYDLYENYELDDFPSFGNVYDTFTEGSDYFEDYHVVGDVSVQQFHSSLKVSNFQNSQNINNMQNFDKLKNFVTLPGQSNVELGVDKEFSETDKMFYELFKITNNYSN